MDTFVNGAIFRMGDFQVTPSGPYRGEVRVSPELLKVFGPTTYLPAQVIEEAAERLVDAIRDLFQNAGRPSRSANAACYRWRLPAKP